ncbi:MAG: hypothetical protein A3G41_06785 [Elusimicrobia bacterium RIFCSPLOWO2_12_FULL_59_9]|nr:MAG: hypothetical protein A3G41_06785 [Elusimicrobia bacterium RIFCSPLOWO2_12_FULL_59_9]
MKSKIIVTSMVLSGAIYFSLPQAHAEPTLALVEGDQCKFFPTSGYKVESNGMLYPMPVLQNHKKAKAKSAKGQSGETPAPYPDESLGYSLKKVQKFLKVDIEANRGKQNIVYTDKDCAEKWCYAQALTQEEYDKPDQQQDQQKRPQEKKKVLCVYTPEEAAKSETSVIEAIKFQIEKSDPKSGIAKKQAQLAQQFFQTREKQVASLSKEFKTATEAKQAFEGSRGGVGTPRETGGVRLGGTPGETLDTGNAQVQDTQQALSNAALTQRPDELPKPTSSEESSSPLSSNAAKGVAATGILGTFLYGWRKYKSDAGAVLEAAKHPVETYSTIQESKAYEWEQGATRRRVEEETERTMAKMEKKEKGAEEQREKDEKAAEEQRENAEKQRKMEEAQRNLEQERNRKAEEFSRQSQSDQNNPGGNLQGSTRKAAAAQQTQQDMLDEVDRQTK